MKLVNAIFLQSNDVKVSSPYIHHPLSIILRHHVQINVVLVIINF